MTTKAPAAPTPEMVFMWRMTAYGVLSGLKSQLDGAMASVAGARRQTDAWSEDFWATCGYDRAVVEAALTELEKLAAVYPGAAGLAGTHDFQADAQVLTVQAPLP